MLLVGCALAGRLENTYLPPPGAAQSGGINLATPFVSRGSGAIQAPQNTYLPPGQSGIQGGSLGNALRAGSSFGSGSSSFSSTGSSVSSSSGTQSLGQASFNRAGQQQINSFNSGFQQPTQRPVLIIKQVNENTGDGTYTFR